MDPLIKWIPKSARSQCATLLTKLLLSVVKTPNSLVDWEALLLFGKRVLSKLPRGGHHRNLSNVVTRRCMNFGSGGVTSQGEGESRLKARKNRGTGTKSKEQD